MSLLARLHSEHWLVSKDFLHVLLPAVQKQLDIPASYDQPQEADPTPAIIRYGAIGIIPICGPILKNPDYFDLKYLGACDVDSIREMCLYAAGDPTIETVILYLDSPGGIYTGVPEAAAAIAELAQVKPVIAFTDTRACSAAYWLASQASEIYLTQSASLGSIGVYSIYTDASKAYEQMGVKINAISVGTFKLAGAPFKPMTAEEEAMFQADIQRIGDEFHGAILANRELSADVMQGQVFSSELAVTNNLADGIVGSFDELIVLRTA